MPRPKNLQAPEPCARGAKIGVHGEWGTGKTELVMSATKVAHLLLHDSEGRSQYYDPEKDHGFEAIYSNDINDAIALLKYAEELYRKGERVAFGLDSFSSIWFAQQEVAERIGSTSRGTAKYDSWGPAKKPLKQFYAALYETPVDCIITMRSKPKYEINEKNAPEKQGYNVPDTERGLNYAVDLVVEMAKDELPPGKPLAGQNFYCTVVKTSGPKDLDTARIGTVIRDPTFEKLLWLRRAGQSVLSIASGVELQVLQATVRSASSLKRFIADNGLDEQEVFGMLKDRFGKFDARDIERYVEAIYGQVQEGRR